jgi:deazaflavin-dependent oxidoreductase (nitroreductase family)
MSFSKSLQTGALKLHQAAYERTNGRVGHRLFGMTILLLHTTGRRTGKDRVNPLVYANDGGDYVLVASNNGSDHPPGWLFNVRNQGDVEFQVGDERHSGQARVLERGEDGYDRLWQLVNEQNKRRYDGYQAKTERAIPLVIVTPR